VVIRKRRGDRRSWVRRGLEGYKSIKGKGVDKKGGRKGGGKVLR